MTGQEIRKTETLCIEEHAPACVAACPLHIDMRAITGHIREGSPECAREAFLSRALFPHILAKICDAPCKAVCRRQELDAPIATNELERWLMHTPEDLPPIRPTMQHKKRAAVVGAGLSGMSAARFLVEKGYEVHLFEREDGAFPRLRGLAGIMEDDIKRDAAPVLALITPHFHTCVGETVSWDDLRGGYAAVYISSALPEALLIDPATLRVGDTNLFAAGRRISASPSCVRSLSDGRRAAASMDRFMQNVSLTAARVHEGAYETELPVAIPDLPVEYPADGPYDSATALHESRRCLDCHCMQCVRACTFMQKFEKFPRQYIREIANTLSLVGNGMRSGRRQMLACSQCGLCSEICPNAIPMPQIVASGKRALVKKKDLPPAIYDFPLRDMLYSNSDSCSLFRHAPGEEASEYLFFPGCQLGAGNPEVVLPAYRWLLKRQPQTGIALGCCGAPADWAGQEALYGETMAALRAEIAALGSPTLVAACPTCMRQLQAAGLKAVSLYELLADGMAPTKGMEQGRLAVHDSCSARHDEATQASVRTLITAAGYTVEELPYSRGRTKCCGYGGLVFYGDRDVAARMIAERAEESDAPYACYCNVCRDYLSNSGKQAVHVLDLLFANGMEGAARPAPSITEKEHNRATLKQHILSELYGEHEEAAALTPLYLADGLQAILEDRLITETNVRQAILEAEQAGSWFLRPSDGHRIASHRPGIITYWVEYAAEGEGYRVYNAYSHRMHIIREEQA